MSGLSSLATKAQMSTCTSSGDNCAKRILGAFAARLSGRAGADGGGEDALLDTCLAEVFMGNGSERVCAVVVVCNIKRGIKTN